MTESTASRLSQCMIISEGISAMDSSNDASKLMSFASILAEELKFDHDSLGAMLRHTVVSNRYKLSNTSLCKLVAAARPLPGSKNSNSCTNIKSKSELKSVNMLSLPCDSVSTIISFLSSKDINQVKTLSRKVYRASQKLSIYANHKDYERIDLDRSKLMKLLASNGDAFVYQKCKKFSLNLQNGDLQARRWFQRLIQLSTVNGNYRSNWLLKLLENVELIHLQGFAITCITLLPIRMLFGKCRSVLNALVLSQCDADHRSVNKCLAKFSAMYKSHLLQLQRSGSARGHLLKSLCLYGSFDFFQALDLRSSYTQLQLYPYAGKIQQGSDFYRWFHPKLSTIKATRIDEEWFQCLQNFSRKPPKLNIQELVLLIDDEDEAEETCRLLFDEDVVNHLQLADSLSRLNVSLSYGIDDGSDATALWDLLNGICEGDTFAALKKVHVRFGLKLQYIEPETDRVGVSSVEECSTDAGIEEIKQYFLENRKEIDSKHLDHFILEFIFKIPDMRTIRQLGSCLLTHDCREFHADVMWTTNINDTEWEEQFKEVEAVLQTCLDFADAEHKKGARALRRIPHLP